MCGRHTNDHASCTPGDKVAAGLTGTPAGQCTLVQRIGPHVVILGKDVTISTTLNPEIEVSLKSSWKAVPGSTSTSKKQREAKTKSRRLHGTFALLWRAVLPREVTKFSYIVLTASLQKVNLVPLQVSVLQSKTVQGL